MGIVNSTTIQEITRDAAYKLPPEPAPTLSQIFNQNARKASLIVDFQKAQRKKTGVPTPSEKLKNAVNTALNDIPPGFDLVPLVYTRVSQQHNKSVKSEFKNKVKPRFLRYIARHHANELRAMGICEHGIKRMLKGSAPTDKNGREYAVSVDHVVERSGGGKMSHEKAHDPKLATMFNGSAETYRVNHFDNLILLPDDVHFQRKNAINDIQYLQTNVKPDRSIWALMLIPKRDAETGMYAYCAKRPRTGHLGPKAANDNRMIPPYKKVGFKESHKPAHKKNNFRK